MAIGTGIIAQAKLRPIRTQLNGATGFGGGINYGMGIGAVRIAGVTYSFLDSAGMFSFRPQTFVARIAVFNGDYPFSAQTFTTATDLSQVDCMYDAIINSDPGPTFLNLWPSGIATDDGQKLTVLISQINWLSGGPPAGMIPQAFLNVHADHYKSRELALSQGSIFEQ